MDQTETETVGAPPYKPIMTALIEASKHMPSLVKGERNQHGNYNYVSIDDYYEVVAKIALAHGLTWKVSETTNEVIETGRANAIKTGYSFDLIHAASSVVWNNYFFCTITHPIQGAQTAGSSMSYAVKLFLRSSFHIVTGEQDADATDSKSFSGSAAPAPQPSKPKDVALQEKAEAPVKAALSPEEIDGLKKMFTMGIDMSKTLDELKVYYSDNEPEFKRLKQMDLEAHKQVMAHLNGKKKSFN